MNQKLKTTAFLLTASIFALNACVNETYQSNGNFSSPKADYKFAFINPETDDRTLDHIAAELRRKGYWVAGPASIDVLGDDVVRLDQAFLISCHPSGTKTRAFIGYSQEVFCIATDTQTAETIYKGVGEHMGDFEYDDFKGAVAAALDKMPWTYGDGRVVHYQDARAVFDSFITASSPNQDKEHSVSTGTGFFVSTRGHVATNHHVIDECKEVYARDDNDNVYKALVLDAREDDDIALLRLKTKSPAYLKLQSKHNLGEYIATFGFPLNSVLSPDGVFTDGKLSSLKGLGGDESFIQISAPIQPGNSGGPLVNQRGELVGVVQSKLNVIAAAQIFGDIPQNVNFAVKSSRLIKMLDHNEVPYSKAKASGKNLKSEQIGTKLKKAVVYIECYQ